MDKGLDHGDLLGLVASFQAIPEYRKNLLNIEHKLVDIITISVCGVIAGAEYPSDIFDWAEVHQQKLTKILQLEHGIPSRDTIHFHGHLILPIIVALVTFVVAVLFRLGHFSGVFELIENFGKRLFVPNAVKTDLDAAIIAAECFMLVQVTIDNGVLKCRVSLLFGG
jgi:hypothetical protein